MKWFGGGHKLPSTVNNSKMELFGTQQPEPPERPEVVARRGAQTPLPHAPEVRMTVVYLNSLKLF